METGVFWTMLIGLLFYVEIPNYLTAEYMNLLSCLSLLVELKSCGSAQIRETTMIRYYSAVTRVGPLVTHIIIKFLFKIKALRN
jgi:hypothetical protein